MNKSKEIVVRDRKVGAYCKEIVANLNGGHAAADSGKWAEACAAYLLGLEEVKKALGYCERASKRTYFSVLKEFRGVLYEGLGRCSYKMGQVERSVEYYQQALNEGVKDALNQLFAIFHNRKAYGRAYPYLLQQDKYKTVPLSVLIDYATLLFQGGGGIKKDLKQSLVFFLYIVKRLGEGNDELDGKIEMGYVEETIAEIYCQLKDTAKELEWRLKAVEKDYPDALHNYGEMLNDGEGVRRSEEEALKYHLRAAKLGHFDAMISCAIHYYKSDTLPVNREAAEYWLNCALPLDPAADAAALYCGLIIGYYLDNPEKIQKVHELIPILEKHEPDEAKSVRALLLLYSSEPGPDEVMQAADILTELADKGLASAQFNLAVLYHTYTGFRRELALPLYLDSLAQGLLLARHNLYPLIIELAIESNGDESSILKFFRSIEQRYRRALPADLRKEDKYLPEYVKLIGALEQGVKGNVTELLKTFFPKVHAKINTDIASVSSTITRTALAQSTPPADRIAAVLELCLVCGSSMRAKTCAFRRIGEIVATNPGGFQALMENLDEFNQLTADIIANSLNNETYIELAIGLAKLQIHPESSLVKHCYQKLYEFHGSKFKTENIDLSPYQCVMLLSALSEMPVSREQLSGTLFLVIVLMQARIARMNAWELLKNLHSLCVIHANHATDQNNNFSAEIFGNLLRAILEVNTRKLLMVDCYQFYLCLNYIDERKVGETQSLRKKFQPQFSEMMSWLKIQQSTVSHSQERLTTYLGSYRRDIFGEKYINGLYVDIYLQNINAGVEFDDRFHFMWHLPQEDLPLLRVTRDSFHEAIIGLPIVRVDCFEFDSLDHSNPENIRVFLQKKLAVLGVSLEEPQVESEQKSDELVRDPSSACK